MKTKLIPGKGFAEPRGATLTAHGVNFSVYSETAERIWVSIFDAKDHECARHLLDGRSGSVHFGFVEGLAVGARYGLRADGPFVPSQGLHFDPNKLLVDPYALRLDGAFTSDPRLALPRSESVDTASFVPKAIITRLVCDKAQPLVVKPNLIYELNVRGFSKLDEDVYAPERGHVAALTTAKTADHFEALGVNVLELMPVSAWTDDRHLPALGLTNAWGYNPVCFLAPDIRLMPRGMADLREVTDFYRTRNVAVIIDVVFNHTGEGDIFGPTLSLRGLDERTYYRHEQVGTGLHLVNHTGTGNTLRCDHPEVQRLILSAMRHWVEEGGVSGFRFDLATIMGRGDDGFDPAAPLLQAIKDDPVLGKCLLIAEPWDPAQGGYQLGKFGVPFLEWNDRYRDDVRAFWRGDTQKIGAFASALSGSSDVFKPSGRKPAASVNFLASHDGFTLRDLVSYVGKHNELNGENNRDGHAHNLSWNNGVEGETDRPDVLKKRQTDMRALLAILFLSRGTPMLQQGDEMGRTQQGNNNAYAQDNAHTWVDWANADTQLIAYTQKLASFRKRHPALSADRFLTGHHTHGLPDVRWLHPEQREMRVADWEDADAGVLGMHLCIEGDEVLLWFNRHDHPVLAQCALPELGNGWSIGFASSQNPLSTQSGTSFDLPARSVVVLVPAAA